MFTNLSKNFTCRTLSLLPIPREEDAEKDIKEVWNIVFFYIFFSISVTCLEKKPVASSWKAIAIHFTCNNNHPVVSLLLTNSTQNFC